MLVLFFLLDFCPSSYGNESNRLCHTINGSVTILLDGRIDKVKSDAILKIVDVLGDETFLSHTQPAILSASLNLPVTSSLSRNHSATIAQDEALFSILIIASFFAGLILTVLILVVVSRRLSQDTKLSRGKIRTRSRGGLRVGNCGRKQHRQYVELEDKSPQNISIGAGNNSIKRGTSSRYPFGGADHDPSPDTSFFDNSNHNSGRCAFPFNSPSDKHLYTIPEGLAWVESIAF